MKYFMETFGCQMNVRDSTEMGEHLEKAGYSKAERPEDADLILVNTCTVRQKAVHKGVSALGRYAALKKERPGLKVGACGCYAQQAGKRLLSEIKGIDMVLGPDDERKVAVIAGELDAAVRARPVVSTCLDGEQHAADATPRPRKASGVSEFVTIMRGCDNFCSFCVVPHVRGREVSRDPRSIIGEIGELVDTGAAEITLLGQNVNSYGAQGGPPFPELLKMVCAVPGLKRVRFTTSHPKDMSPELAGAFSELDKLMPQIHLPVQAGSDAVLARMNRRYTKSDYLGKVALLRAARPDVAITTDIIVGFPGETDGDFAETMSIVEEVRYDGAFSFKYSVRPGTAAASMRDDVEPRVKSQRLYDLQKRVQEIAVEKSAALAGRVLPVLVEGAGRDPGQICGRTPCNRVINFAGEKRPGTVADVEVTEALAHSLLGREIKPEAVP